MENSAWEKVKTLFEAALQQPPSERAHFLALSCPQEELRQEVEKLVLDYEESGSFLETPIVKMGFPAFDGPNDDSAGDDSLQANVESLFAVEPQPGTASPDPLPDDSAEISSFESACDPMIGRRVGAYQITRRIGFGGMAAVYLASRADDQYRKQVAIKIVRPGLGTDDLLARFRTERQTLASLDHPNIVKLTDGGSTEEGLPFLVMDYVAGTPIDAYCDSRSLPIDERLHLFRKVCSAVHYAHLKSVIHRDLKPSNILVTSDGIPMLLDFGIAKVLNSGLDSQTVAVTRTLARRMTPAYASPEQVRGEPVTPATDIYSLGVVLYEMLTGHRPYRLKQCTPSEIERAICEQDPENPSTAVDRVETFTSSQGITITRTPELVSQTREGHPDRLRRRLRGDLDKIALMALHKDAKRRYASAEEFSQDIQRHLEHLPVKARRSTLRYRTSKLLKRRRMEAIAGALMVLLLLAGFAFTAWETRRAAERAQAESAGPRARGRRSVAVLGFKNLSGRPETAWLSTALAEMLTTELAAGEKLRTISGENVAQVKINLSLPETDTLAEGTLRRVYKNLGSDFVVLGSYLDLGGNGPIRLDLRLQDAVAGETLAAVAETGTEADLAGLVARAGATLRDKLGVTGVSPAESAKVKLSVPSNPEAVRLYAEGLAKLRAFDALGARDLLEKAIAADPGFALSHSALAECWVTLGYDEKAKEEAKKALDLAANLPREQSLWVEARYFRAAGDWDKATDLYRTLFNFFPDNLDYGLRLVEVQTEAGRLDDSLATVGALRKLAPPASEDPRIDLQEATAAQASSDYKRDLAAAMHAERKGKSQGARLVVAEARALQGRAYRTLGDLNKSISASSEAKQLFAEASNRFGEARALSTLGNALFDQNDLERAKEAYEESLELYHQLGNKSGEAGALTLLGNVSLYQRDLTGAAGAYKKSLVLSREVGYSRQAALALHNLGLAEKDQGHLTRAKEYLHEALPLARHYGDKGLQVGCLLNLAHVFAAEGEIGEAKKLAQESLQIRRQAGSKPRTAAVLSEFGDLQLVAGDLLAAEKLYAESLQILTEIRQEFPTSYPLFGLGDILLARGDLAGARKRLEAALALRLKERGAVRELFDSRIRLAELSLEEGQAAGAEAGVRRALQEYPAHAEPEAQVEADSILVRALLAQNKVTEAQRLVATDRQLLADSEDRFDRLRLDLSAALVQAASGKPADAAKSLHSVVEQSRKAGFGGLQLQARLALGEAEIKSGNASAGSSRLAILARDARSQGFTLIARKAAAASRQRER